MRSREGSKCFSRAGHCTGCFAHVSLSNSWSFQYPHFKGGEQETQRSSNKLPHVIQLSAEAGVWTQFRFLWPIQFVLFTQPTSGSAARILLALPWRIYLFLKRVISLRATFDFFFFNFHNLSRTQLRTWRWERECPDCKAPCLLRRLLLGTQHTLPLENAFITSAWRPLASTGSSPPRPGC